MRTILGLLNEKQLYAKYSKCEFWLSSVSFLGHMVSKKGVMMDPQKLKVVRNWAKPTNVMESQSFMGWLVITVNFLKGLQLLLYI